MKDCQIHDSQVVFKSNSFYLSFMLAKNLHNVEIVISDGVDNRRVANFVEVVDIDSIFNEKLDHCCLVISAGIVQ